jgi:hypothetical protein
MNGYEGYGSSEPGIVLVSMDGNRNGKPDDTWYELKGSEYDHPLTDHRFTHTYTRTEDTLQNPFHRHPYFPQWITSDELTFTGSLLRSRTELVNGQYVQHVRDFGYADNKTNSDTQGTSFDISWAVDADGKSVNLPCIDFVSIYTAVHESYPLTGELSTELSGAVDLNMLYSN